MLNLKKKVVKYVFWKGGIVLSGYLRFDLNNMFKMVGAASSDKCRCNHIVPRIEIQKYIYFSILKKKLEVFLTSVTTLFLRFGGASRCDAVATTHRNAHPRELVVFLNEVET